MIDLESERRRCIESLTMARLHTIANCIEKMPCIGSELWAHDWHNGIDWCIQWVVESIYQAPDSAADLCNADGVLRELRRSVTKHHEELAIASALDRQSREAAQAEISRLSRELNEARHKIGVLLEEIAGTAIASGMMAENMRAQIDGPNAIQFLRLMTKGFENERNG